MIKSSLIDFNETILSKFKISGELIKCKQNKFQNQFMHNADCVLKNTIWLSGELVALVVVK